jgi:alkylation response protein AidB-like acyl-CoA dehydrogenase
VQFELSDEEKLLQETVADFGREHFGGAAATRAPEVDWRTPWEAFTAMGLTGILVPEELGGSGGTLLDACLVAEQLGRADAWIPFAGTGVLAASALLAGEDDDPSRSKHLAELAEGGVFSLMVDDRLDWPAGPPRLALDWREGARGVLCGAEGIEVVDLSGTEGPPADPLHPTGLLAGPAPRAGRPSGPRLRRALAAGRVGLAAWLTGVATVALEEAVAHARERRQFGVPVGSFQAVQHLCADMLVDVETSRSVAYGAAWTVAQGPPAEAERVAAAAKSWCSAAAVRVCQTSIQVFGGIGVTLEHPAHLRLRTAHHFGAALGSARQINQQLGRAATTDGEGGDGSR